MVKPVTNRMILDHLQIMQGDIRILQESMQGVQGDVHGFNESMQGVQGDVHGLNESMQGVQGDVHGLNESMQGVQGDIHGLNESMQGVQSDMYGLKEGVQIVRSTQGAMQIELNGLQGAVLDMRRDTQQRFEKMDKRIDRLQEDMVRGFGEARIHRQALQEDLYATIHMVGVHEKKLAKIR